MPNCYVVGLDVTHQCRMTAQQLDGLQGRGRHGTFLRSISQFYLDYHRCLFFFQLFLFSYLDFHTWMGGHAAPQGCSEC